MMNEWIIHLFVLLFAMSAWLSINTIYVQLPILTLIAPESWNLPTYIVLLIQLSCTFPLIYSILRNFRPDITRLIQTPLVILLLIIDIFGLVLSTLTYTYTVTIGDNQSSLWLLISIFILCIPCTMADVVFLPLIGGLRSASYITTFYVGMGAGAFLPSVLAFAQAFKGLDFSFSVFVYIICGAILVSLAAYLVVLRQLRKNEDSESSTDLQSNTSIQATVSPYDSSLTFPLIVSLVGGSLQNAILPGILSYACQPFDSNIYSLSTNLFVMTNPLFCFIQHFYSFSSNIHLSILSILSLIPSIFIIILSIQSLSVPDALLPIASAFSAGFLSLIRTASASRLAQSSYPKALFLCGASTQVYCIYTSQLINNLSWEVLSEQYQSSLPSHDKCHRSINLLSFTNSLVQFNYIHVISYLLIHLGWSMNHLRLPVTSINSKQEIDNQIMKTQQELNQVIQIMRDNMVKIAERGENLSQLSNRADALHETTNQFSKSSVTVSRKYERRSRLYYLYAILAIIMILLILYVIFIGFGDEDEVQDIEPQPPLQSPSPSYSSRSLIPSRHI